MATQRGPKIVTNGLITHLDVADKKSYAGSGATIWSDLSGRNEHYTLYNSPTFANNFGGELQFDGVNDYARRRSSNINTLLQGSFSIEIWMRSYTGTFGTNHNGRFVSVANDAGTGSDSTSTQGTDNDNAYFNIVNQNASSYLSLNGWTGTYCSESSVTYLNTDKYYQVVFTVDVVGGGVYQNYYLNGNSRAFLSWSRSPFSGNNNITLAMHSAGAVTNALSNVKTAFAIFKFYSRVLSVAEIRQNFNTLRGRFNI
jgi:hypothetical protein